MSKIEDRMNVLKMIANETALIESAIGRRNYWKKVLKKIDGDNQMPVRRVVVGER